MNFKTALFITLMSLFISCSSNNDKKRHDLFLRDVQVRRDSLSKLEYNAYIKKMVDVKEGELMALRQQSEKSNKMMDHHEVMSGSTGRDTYSFNKTTTGMNLKKIDTRIKNVEKELYLLRSQLAR